MNETETQQLYQEIFRDYRGQGWTCWQGHFVAKINRNESVKKTMARALEAHPNWKGGRILQEGYIDIKMGNHPRATSLGYVGEHILMAELEILGHFLPEKAIVHHRNEITTDNIPENLQVLSGQGQHNQIHREMRALKECGYADWLRCCFCKKYGPEGEMSWHMAGRSKNYKQGYHWECIRAYSNAGYARRRDARLQLQLHAQGV